MSPGWMRTARTAACEGADARVGRMAGIAQVALVGVAALAEVLVDAGLRERIVPRHGLGQRLRRQPERGGKLGDAAGAHEVAVRHRLLQVEAARPHHAEPVLADEVVIAEEEAGLGGPRVQLREHGLREEVIAGRLVDEAAAIGVDGDEPRSCRGRAPDAGTPRWSRRGVCRARSAPRIPHWRDCRPDVRGASAEHASPLALSTRRLGSQRRQLSC